MASHLFFSQLALIVLVWLFFLRRCVTGVDPTFRIESLMRLHVYRSNHT